MGESRERFLEGLEILLRAFKQERFSFEGEHDTVNETTLRPRPRHPDLVDRMLVAGASPETVPLTAELGLGMLILNHKPWPEYRDDGEGFNAIRRERGWPPLRPIAVVNAYCTEDDDEAWQGLLTHFGEMKDGTNRHYEWDDPQHFREAGGYEHYARLGEQRVQRGERSFSEDSSRTQVFGTPERCLEQLL